MRRRLPDTVECSAGYTVVGRRQKLQHVPISKGKPSISPVNSRRASDDAPFHLTPISLCL